ncbi:hypothetical protein BASA81_003522 [Batrachochytrium salamandrivorans]|nr:hypothetical protein BASA81_003522 [Batrachochytrium salamandrivorans]
MSSSARKSLPSSASAPSSSYHEAIHPQARSKKDPWTGEEDELLLRLVDELGNRWRDIAITINHHYGFEKRIGKQCRERFLNRGLKNSPWTPEEDELLRQNQKVFGNKWASIAAAMPGRPENQVKNRWNAANFNKHSPTSPSSAQNPSSHHPPSSSFLRMDKRPRLSFLDQTPISLPGTPSASSVNAYWQAQAMTFPPNILFPQYFAQQQQVHHQQQQLQQHQHMQQQQHHHQPLFAPLVEALEMANPVAAMQTPPSSCVAQPLSLGLSPPSSCYDLFEALKTDTERQLQAAAAATMTATTTSKNA